MALFSQMPWLGGGSIFELRNKKHMSALRMGRKTNLRCQRMSGFPKLLGMRILRGHGYCPLFSWGFKRENNCIKYLLWY